MAFSQKKWIWPLTAFALCCLPGVLLADVVINEIHYDPEIKTEWVEFVELYNTGAAPVDLSGWRFSSGIDYTFPAATQLGVGATVIVGQDPAAITTKFGVSALGPFTGSLGNRGERITLRDANGVTIDSVDYGQGFPWPTIGEVPAYSAQLLNPAADRDLGGNWRSAAPTPAAANTAVFLATNAIPPRIRQVKHTPKAPVSTNAVTITAKVTDPDGVASVILSYQIVDPGAYIRKGDAAYELVANWTDLAMADGGLSGDAVAGDATWSVVLPASLQVHRRLVRYRITVEDSLGYSLRVPYADDQQPNFAYFVYDGVPAWTGAVEPGVTTPTNFPAEMLAKALPVYHLVANGGDVDNSQYSSGSRDVRMWGTMVYDGDVYDHIVFYNRGEASTYQSGKNKWRFKFNRGRDFEARDIYGKRYDEDWKTLNFNACASPWVPANRGMAGIDEAVPHRLYQLAGVPSSHTHWTHFRVVDASDESPVDQYAGDLWGLYLALEHPDGRFLDEHDLPDGNVYKIQGGNGNKKNQGPDQPLDNSDWNTFWAGSADLNSVAWWRANFDLMGFFGFRAINRVAGNVDLRDSTNYYMYHDPVLGVFRVMPWDLDMMFAPVVHWSGVIRADRCLDHAEIRTEFRNRCRELLDLLFSDEDRHGGQAAQVVEELSQIVNPTGRPLTMVDVDQAMWNKHPRTRGGHRNTWYPLSVFETALRGDYDRTIDTADHEGFQQNLINFMFDTRSGGGFGVGDRNEDGYGFGYLSLEAADSDIPHTPTITYIGAAGFPANTLRFQSSAFNDPNGAATFGGMRWRIAEISNPSITNYTAGKAWKYEIDSQWESESLTTFDSVVDIPAGNLKVGDTYRVRCRMMDTTGRWSHWSDPITFALGPPDANIDRLNDLVITEIMYRPVGGSDYEFIELRNTGTNVLSVAEVNLDGGIEFAFNGSSITNIDPGAYVVVVGDPAAFASRYDTSSMTIAGEFSGKLSDNGEAIELLGPGAAEIMAFDYNDARGWPLAADGAGHSLVPLTVTGQADGLLDYGGNWRASAFVGGSPGTADPAAAATVVINEVVAHTDTGLAPPDDSDDWIELYNPLGTSVDVSGWSISDDSDALQLYTLPAGSIIPARGFLTLTEILDFHTNRTDGSGFGLNKAGESVFLTRDTGSGVQVVDAVGFKGQENGLSLGRYPDGAAFYYELTPTTNAQNAAPEWHVLISELMVSPPVTNSAAAEATTHEYVELYNPLGTPVDLWTVAGPWRIDGGVEFVFPSNTTIAASEYMVIVGFDPQDIVTRDRFLNDYGLTNGQVRLFGPYAGRLDNRTERVAIERPQDADALGEDVSWIIVDETLYFVDRPWPSGVAATGASLQRVVSPDSGRDPGNWFAALEGTPGVPGSLLAIARPASGSHYFAPDTVDINVAVEALRVSNRVEQVQILEGSNLLCVVTQAPYRCSLSLDEARSYFLSATMHDAAGVHTSRLVIVDGLRIDAHSATGITDVAATCRGALVGKGTANVALYSGDEDGGTDSAGWDHVVSQSASGGASVTVPLTGLTGGRQYYFRFRADVEGRFAWSTNTVSFRTTPLDAWSHRVTVGFPWAPVSPLENFPVLIKLHDGISGFSYAQFASQSGADLRVGDGVTGDALRYEIEHWNTGGVSTVWVQIPHLTSNTTVNVHWGYAPAAGAPPAYAIDGSIWREDYAAVWHLDVPLQDASRSYVDAAANGLSAAPGVVGQALEFDGQGQRVTNAPPRIWYGDHMNGLTVSMWLKPDAATLTASTAWGATSQTNTDFYIDMNRSPFVRKWRLGLGDTEFPLDRYVIDEWQYLALVMSNGNVWTAFNASAPTWITANAPFIPDQSLTLGGRGAPGLPFIGQIDEMRLSPKPLSAAWLRAEHDTVALHDSQTHYGVVEMSAPDPDQDGDGIPDAWEQRFPQGLAIEPDENNDADLLSNYQEFIAGTDPTNTASTFDLSVVTNNDLPVLRFYSIQASGPGYADMIRKYALECLPDFATTQQWAGVQGFTNMPSTGQWISYTNLLISPERHYRARVWLENTP